MCQNIMKNKRFAFLPILLIAFVMSITVFATAESASEPTIKGKISELASYIPNVSDDAILFDETIYARLANGMRNMDSQIDISDYWISMDNVEILGDYVTVALWMNPDIYYISPEFSMSYDPATGHITTISPQYLVTDTKEIASVQNDIRSKIDAIISLTDSLMSDEEKLLTIYDSIILNSNYDQTLTKTDAKSLLLDGESVCQGYASVFYAVATKLGIPCGFVESDAMNHVWNVVYIDGKWYHVDMTWDDNFYKDSTKVTHLYFLKSNAWFETPTLSNTQSHYGFESIENDSDKYDDYFWNNTVSKIILIGDRMYFVSHTNSGNTYGAISYFDTATLQTTDIYTYKTLWRSDDKVYNGAYSGLDILGERLYFNTPDKVLSCNVMGGDVTTEFTLPDTSVSIYGCRIDGNKLIYAIGERTSTHIITQTGHVVLKPTIALHSYEDDDMITAQFSAVIPEEHILVLVVYNKDGRFERSIILPATAYAEALFETLSNGETLKAFIFDENFIPQCENAVC